ncbi:MAG TPA: SIS domain-containing protein [Caldisericia bacterium]|nr:SIS domain-containing protein [Caldisericia bacterium]
MKQSTEIIIEDLIKRYSILSCVKKKIFEATGFIIDCYCTKGKVMICGNGGSASDALHMVGELMKSFVLPRTLSIKQKNRISKFSDNGDYLASHLQEALPAMSLVGEIALHTACANDIASDLCFAQQVYGYGHANDVLFVISTSGNSKNVIYAAEVAMAKEIVVIGLTGALGGKLKNKCDCIINVPATDTYAIQELHMPVFHAICLAVENEFFGKD